MQNAMSMKDMVVALVKQPATNRKAMMGERMQMFAEMDDEPRRQGMRAMIELGIARGEIRNKGLARFPQIMVAPALIAVIWQSLFARHAPLDAVEMLRTHLDLIFGERRTA